MYSHQVYSAPKPYICCRHFSAQGSIVNNALYMYIKIGLRQSLSDSDTSSSMFSCSERVYVLHFIAFWSQDPKT